SLSRSSSILYTLSLHDALPIYEMLRPMVDRAFGQTTQMPMARRRGFGYLTNNEGDVGAGQPTASPAQPPNPTMPGPSDTTTPSTDRKSTRLNSSHGSISYAVFC